jgi:predicted ATPase/DNA-binding CsgD family transcriptional regulator
VESKRELAMTRLLTFTGVGGSGKTRLALEVARDLVGAYQDGVWLVELAPLSEGKLVPQAVARTMSVREQPGRPLIDTLTEALHKKAALLVLDNCEHLADSVAHLADKLLALCSHLRVLTTSRETLEVEGEVVRRVSSLSVPDTDRLPVAAELMGYDAVRLFVERTRLRLSAFEITSENATAVAEVCRKLEGIPLAIELAAARMGTLATQQLAERLRDSLGLLSAGPRTAPPRQRTMRAAIGWSYGLLPAEVKETFARLSVFAGGFTLEAAEGVCPGGVIGEDEILNLLSDLVDKSLVAAEAGGEGRVRYRMLEPVRQYAREKLEEGGQADEVKGRHAAFFLSLAEEAEPELAGPQQTLWVERLEVEHDNLRGALSWFLERGKIELGLRFGGTLWRFWFARGYLSEGIRWLEQALAGSHLEPAPARVKALEGMGMLAQFQGYCEQAKATYEEMLKLSRELGDKGNAATALNSLGTLALAQGDNERAKALLEENLSVVRQLEKEGNAATPIKRFHVLSLLGILALNEEGDYARATTLLQQSLALAREVGDTFRVGTTLVNLGYAAVMRGDNERATALSQEALTLAHELGSAGVGIIPETSINLGLAARGRGEHERAKASLEEALAVSQEAGIKASVVNALEGLAGLAGALGEATRAAHLWGAAEEAREATSIALPPSDRALHEPYLAAARAQLGQAAWEEALAEGRKMALEEAVEYALSKEETDPPTPPAPGRPSAGETTGKLTRREEEVAALVAHGLSNCQIASQLTLSEHTVATHVRNVLKKLGLHSRFQIAAWFTEHQPTS